MRQEWGLGSTVFSNEVFWELVTLAMWRWLLRALAASLLWNCCGSCEVFLAVLFGEYTRCNHHLFAHSNRVDFQVSSITRRQRNVLATFRVNRIRSYSWCQMFSSRTTFHKWPNPSKVVKFHRLETCNTAGSPLIHPNFNSWLYISRLSYILKHWRFAICNKRGFPSSLITLTLMSTGPEAELPHTWPKTWLAIEVSNGEKKFLFQCFQALNNRSISSSKYQIYLILCH